MAEAQDKNTRSILGFMADSSECVMEPDALPDQSLDLEALYAEQYGRDGTDTRNLVYSVEDGETLPRKRGRKKTCERVIDMPREPIEQPVQIEKV